ncbi:hypothetical protein Tco_1407407 [Tanacetum coccineum]
MDTTPRYKNDNQTGQFGNQSAVNVVGARETVGGPVVQQSGILCLTARNLVIMLRNAESQNWLKTPRITRKRCCYVNKLRKVFNSIWQRSMKFLQ